MLLSQLLVISFAQHDIQLRGSLSFPMAVLGGVLMTLSDYWAPGPPSPGFDIMSVFLYRVSCTRVSLGMGSALRYTGICYC